MSKRARIIGQGTYLPKRVLSNHDLEKMVDTTDEWIVSRTGMRERRLADTQECASDMGVLAAKAALASASLSPLEIDLVLVATMTPDYLFPSTAALIQSSLGATNAAAVDIQAACTGFLYALSMAKAYIESGRYHKVLLVASEKMSSFVDYRDRNTCILFGDGASAAIVASEGTGLAIEDVRLGADGSLAHLLYLPAGGGKHPTTTDTLSSNMHHLKMNGKELFRHAVRRMGASANECLRHCSVQKEQLSWFVPHQANERIIDALADELGISSDKVYKTVHKYGNTSASSIAIALHELSQEKSLAPDKYLLLVAFGAGLTWGASLLKPCGVNHD